MELASTVSIKIPALLISMCGYRQGDHLADQTESEINRPSFTRETVDTVGFYLFYKVLDTQQFEIGAIKLQFLLRK